jgi:hypothetical protein
MEEALESRWKRICWTAATENSIRGNGHDLNDSGSPMDNGGLGTTTEKNCTMDSSEAV